MKSVFFIVDEKLMVALSKRVYCNRLCSYLSNSFEITKDDKLWKFFSDEELERLALGELVISNVLSLSDFGFGNCDEVI